MEVIYLENGDLAMFDGHRFRRDKTTGYYLNSAMRKRLHRYVWEYHNGHVPEGYHVHHRDGNKRNNEIDNLELLSAHDHEALHGELLTAEDREWRRSNVIENAMPKAKEWHKSEEGIAWHKEHGKQAWANCRPSEATCEWCGRKFVTYKPETARFCSGACKSAQRRSSGADNETRVCEYCGKQYTANKYSRSHTCSRACTMRMRWNIKHEVIE